MTTRILIADDHEIVLEGIRTLLSRARRDWEVCGEARNGKEAVEMVRALNPDIAVLDVTMPVMNGLEAAAEIAKLRSGCRVLIFTMHESERLGVEVRNAGARGYVLKSQAARDLVRAIDVLLGGETFYGRSPEPLKPQEEKTSRETFSARPWRLLKSLSQRSLLAAQRRLRCFIFPGHFIPSRRSVSR